MSLRSDYERKLKGIQGTTRKRGKKGKDIVKCKMPDAKIGRTYEITGKEEEILENLTGGSDAK